MSTALTEPLYHVELINGREIEKPLPKKLHVYTQAYLIRKLGRELPPQYRALPELNVLTGGRTTEGRREYIVPDVTVVERSAKYEDGDLAEPPIWGVEILSPGQTIGDLFVRAERLLNLGCPLAWVIWPEKQRAWEYSADLEEQRTQLTGRLPSGEIIIIPLSEIWAELQ
jgi:Uma2 family endonuclease